MTSYKVSRHIENIPDFTPLLQILDETVQLMSAPWITLPDFQVYYKDVVINGVFVEVVTIIK